MKNYLINALQFHVLPTILKKSQSDMAHDLGMSPTVMSRRLKTGNFRIADLLKLCNMYHIRLSSFITTDSMASFGDGIIVPEEEWKDLHFTARKVNRALRDGTLQYKDITDATGCSHNAINSLLVSSCQIDRFLHLCNTMAFNLTDFIDDPTLPRIIPEHSTLRDQIDALQSELATLRKELAQQQALNRSLRQQLLGTYQVAED